MERLSDILASIRERAANPFFVSFILSWLAVNWEIPVALFWPDLSQMQSLGFKTVFEYIQFILAKPDSFWSPIGLASAYTILSPIIWNVLRWFNAWAIKWGNGWVFKMSKESNVSTEKYLELRENLKKNSDTISDMINTESRRITAHDETKKALADTQDKLVKTEIEYQDKIKTLTTNHEMKVHALEGAILIERKKADRSTDSSIINGLWNVISQSEIYNITFVNGRYSLRQGQYDKIKAFYYNEETKLMSFAIVTPILKPDRLSMVTEYFELYFQTQQLLRGERNNENVQLERIDTVDTDDPQKEIDMYNNS